MLDIKPLRHFIALAEAKNFHRAAERLHLSQPPLSRRIAALEREVGTPLFERGSRQVTLTPAGEVFQREAVAILEAVARAGALARATAAGSSGLLRIGFTMCAAYSVVPRWVRAMRAAWPQVRVELKEIVSDELPARLAAGEIDLAVMFDQGLRPGQARRRVLSEPMCVALPRNHPRARARQLRIDELKDDPFALTARDAGSRLHAEVMDFCRRHGFEPKVGVEVRLQQTMLSLVDDAHCVALVPDSMRRLAMPGVVFKRLRDAPSVDLYLAWNEANRNPCLPGFFSACAIPDDV